MPSSSGILDEVKGFLADMRAEWPELFQKPPKPAPPPPPPAAPPPPAGPWRPIPAPAADAPLRAALPDGDLRVLFKERCDHWAAALGVTYGTVRVKDQRSLWGSCTREGNLNFNWRLALAPDCVLDYLVVHELSHRAHMDHSRDFWAFVERVCPSHRAHRRWLRKNGEALYRAPRPR